MDDNDVHMETATGQNTEQEPSTQTENAISTDAGTDNATTPQPATEGAIASDASTPVPPETTNVAVAANEPENITATVTEPEKSDMAMDVDPMEPAETKPEAGAEAVKVEEINTDPQPTEDKEAPTEDTKPVPEVATEVEESTDTLASATPAPVPSIVVADTDAQEVTSIDTTKELTETASGETPMDTTTDNKPATTETTDTTEATATDAIPAVRTYTPQFKFTTFAPMITLPTRNILSNFLKSDKNYVLKDIAAAGDKKKSKKRKTGEEGGGVVGEEDDKADVDGEESEAKKNKLEGEEGEDDGGEDAGSGDDDSSDSDSDSDSEGSVIDEMDEDAEAKEVKILYFPCCDKRDIFCLMSNLDFFFFLPPLVKYD